MKYESCEHRYDTLNPDASYDTPCVTCEELAGTRGLGIALALASAAVIIVTIVGLLW